MKHHIPQPKSDRKMLGGLFSSFSMGFLALAAFVIIDTKGIEGHASIATDPDSLRDMLADDAVSTDEATMQAMARLGYIPEGMSIDTVSAATTSSEFIVASLDGLSFLSAAVFKSDDELFEIEGIHALPQDALCQGEGGLIFSCADWISEGVHTVLMASRNFRCTKADGGAGVESAATLVRCEMNIGGDWFDYADWGVSNGYAVANPDSPATYLVDDARAAPHGVWKAGWNAPGLDMPPARNVFSPQEIDQVWHNMQPR